MGNLHGFWAVVVKFWAGDFGSDFGELEGLELNYV